MKKFLKVILLSGLFGLMLLPENIFAHSLWIEKNTDGKLSVCFGEFGEGLREKSGGRLDKISDLGAWSIGSDGKATILEITKSDDRFVLVAANGNVIVREETLPVRKPESKDPSKLKSPSAKSFLYARSWDGTAADLKPELKLDILPVQSAAGQFLVLFDGEPQSNKELTVTYANGWSKELKTNADGIVTIDQPWAGLYIVDVSRVIEKAGTFDGQPYENERYHTSLSLEK